VHKLPDIGIDFLTENFYDLMSNGLVYGEVWIKELVGNVMFEESQT
jgi:hypothetical protein